MHKPSIWLRAVLFVEGGFERVGRWVRLLVHSSESRPRTAVLLAMLVGLIAVAVLIAIGVYWAAAHHHFWATVFVGLKALKFVGIGVLLAALGLARSKLLQFELFRRLRDQLVGTRDAINVAVAPGAPVLRRNPGVSVPSVGAAKRS